MQSPRIILPRMKQYAFLHVLRGHCNSMGLSEIKFQYPLKIDRERELYKKALEKITLDPFQLSFFWSLVNGAEYKAFVQACATISSEHPEPIIIPDDIMHGKVTFDVNFRFDGYTFGDKDRLVQELVNTNISPSKDALDFAYRHIVRERELFGAPHDPERLAQEERMTFARHLSFHTEE